MKMIFFDIIIRESEHVNSLKYISCGSRIPGVLHGFEGEAVTQSSFIWEDRPTSKASSFCKTQPSNCGKVPLSSLSSLFSCFWVMSQEQKPVFFLVVGEILKFHCSHFGEARALPGDAVRPAGNQAQRISPSQRILVWRYSRFPTLLPFRMQTMCHDHYLCFRMIRIVYLRVSSLQFWTWEAKVGSRSATKCSPGHIARSVSWMGGVLLWGWVLGKHWNNS